MTSFLEHIAQLYKVDDAESLKNTCFVFPSRRASLYFKEILKEQNQEIAFWAPATFSIEEFVQEQCPEILLADDLQLILKLFKIYGSIGGTEEFDEFYSWGKVLLNDFDQIDRYLVDGEKVYKNLQEVENIEATFGPSEELVKALKSFKKVLDDGKDGRLTSNFTENWLLVGKIYSQLKAELTASGKGYLGMIYQVLAEKMTSGNIEIPYREVVFAGFNAITTSEDSIINKLLETGKGRVFFDADQYYLDDDKEEAGLFLRKNRRRWYKHPKVEWVVTNGFTTGKTVEIIGIEHHAAQTRAAAELIEKYGEKSTAIVMGDEGLISPMLYSLPDTAGDVNITMGFPVAGSSLANLTRAYFKYQESFRKTSKGQVYVNREQLLNMASQPGLTTYLGDSFNRLKTGKSTYLVIETVNSILDKLDKNIHSLVSPLFNKQDSIHGAIECIIEFLSAEYYVVKQDKSSILNNGIRLTLLRHLDELNKELMVSPIELSYGILDKILRESYKQLSTPFSGEPLAQLQVMGFLESRALDFKNLIVLSVNEDTIPVSSGSNSYIPFNIRKAFGLPTFLDQNAIYAYHFFRLLQRAENITLVYSTQLSVTGAGEQSRFIYQLIEKARTSLKINISRKTWSPVLPEISSETLQPEIEKSGKVLAQLNTHLASLEQDKILSPTQLVDYITCSYKYYLARILKIKEPDIESDKIDARTFGNLLHELLETCYTPWIGKTITAKEIEQRSKDLPQLADDLFKDYDSTNGESKFSKNLILKLAGTILKNDRADAPIFIHDLESKNEKLKTSLKVNESIRVNIGGFIDRLDMITVDNIEVHRVLDYKTGSAKLKPDKFRNKPLTDEEYILAHFEDPQYKSGFQLLFYILVLKQMNRSWQLNGGIVGVRKVNSGIDYLRSSARPISEDIIREYERQLKNLIEEIGNPAVPFRQTDDIKRCEYCQFRRICNR